jgi:hypothetical protein
MHLRPEFGVFQKQRYTAPLAHVRRFGRYTARWTTSEYAVIEEQSTFRWNTGSRALFHYSLPDKRALDDGPVEFRSINPQ